MKNFWRFFCLLCFQFWIGTDSAGLKDGDICEAASWGFGGGGLFSEAGKWKAKKAPLANEVIVLTGSSNAEVKVVKKRSVGHLVLVSTNLVLEENMDVTGNLDCAGGECPASAKGVFFDFGQDQVCPNVADDGTVCAASAWISTKTGAFSNAANWKAKKVPKANDVVVAKGNGKVSIQVSGKKATAGHVTLYGTNLVLGSSGMEIVGKLDCSEGGCPKTAKAAKLQLAGYTSKQVRSAAAGKTASQGGLNKPDVAKVLKANKIAYSSKDSSAVLRAKLQQLLNPAASYFLMDMQKMCTDQGQAPQTTKKPGQTTKKPGQTTQKPDSGGDVCYASAWMSKVNGYFDDPKKWTRKTLPKTTDIVILAGARVESKKPVTSGHVVITSGIFSITSGRVTVGGNLVCIGDKCQSKKLLTFDLGESKMCMVDGQTTAKPKTTKKPGKTTKKPGKTTKKPKKTTPKKTTKKPGKTTKKPKKTTPKKTTKKPKKTTPKKTTAKKTTAKKTTPKKTTPKKTTKKPTKTTKKLIGAHCERIETRKLTSMMKKKQPSTFTVSSQGCGKVLAVNIATTSGFTYQLNFDQTHKYGKDVVVTGIVTVNGKKQLKYKVKGKAQLHFVATSSNTELVFTTLRDTSKKCKEITISLATALVSKCKRTTDGCKNTCQGKSCDYWGSEEEYSCHALVKTYGCNCHGCKCHVDKDVCESDKCEGKTCDQWVELGWSCSELRKSKKCSCNLCQCNTPKKSCMIITGVFDVGTGGSNGVELYTTCDVEDATKYVISSSINGKGLKKNQRIKFGKSAKIPKDTFIYVTSSKERFAKFFRFDPEIIYDLKLSGNDAVQLSMDTKAGRRIVDTYGDINEDGFKTSWDYENGFGYRKDETGPDTDKYQGKNWHVTKRTLKQKNGNGGAKKYGGTFPVGTYCFKKPCVRLTTTSTTTSTTTTSQRAQTTTSTSTTSTTTTTLGGCTNKAACNYNKAAKGDDGSCKLPKKCHDCKDKCICKKDICGVCGGGGPGSDMNACKQQKGVQLPWVGDGTCDDAHNTCKCGWDKGDCCGEKNKYTGKKNDYKFCKECKCKDPTVKVETKLGDCGTKCNGKCKKPKYKGDKYCDDENNNCACNWDGGDCCGEKNNYKYCKDCKCGDCKFKHKSDQCTKKIKGKCSNAAWKGDKNCDDGNNNAGCNWDDGDCCGTKNNYGFCKQCKCLDCTFVSKGDACVKSMKKGCGAEKFVGDKFCDDANNNAGCNWDKGDCCGPKNNYKFCKACKCLDCTFVSKGDKCTKSIKKGCGSPNWKGDGNCDDNNNNAGCTWDGGDCCGAKNYGYCKKCKCLDCTYVTKGDACVKDMKKSCGAPKFKGDGYCDDSNNVAGCSWDGGDCCGPKANIKYCKECACKDCTSKYVKKCPGKAKGCILPNFKGDKNCDDENNNCRCDWDGGDCCAKTAGGSVNMKYCKACQCLDPENLSDSNCKGGCKLAAYQGDGNCDDENNNCGCKWDGGDCCKKTVKGGSVSTKYCKQCKCLDPKGGASSGCTGGCGAAKYKGDGNCDDENNNCGCDYDGGDCCKATVEGGKVGTKFCKQCKCLDPKNQPNANCDKSKNKCGAAKYKGDGNCDDENNNCGCEYDGGDCCLKNVVKKYCKQCKCLDPAKANKCDTTKNKCGAAKYKGDGNCDDENNNCGCEYDGGDCCAKTLKKAVSKKFCKKCECLDPQGK